MLLRQRTKPASFVKVTRSGRFSRADAFCRVPKQRRAIRDQIRGKSLARLLRQINGAIETLYPKFEGIVNHFRGLCGQLG